MHNLRNLRIFLWDTDFHRFFLLSVFICVYLRSNRSYGSNLCNLRNLRILFNLLKPENVLVFLYLFSAMLWIMEKAS